MLHKLRARVQDEKGFTLIELLVVILIIGILAAIALPAFLNQREKAQDSEAKSGARTAQTALETVFTDNQSYAGRHPGRRSTPSSRPSSQLGARLTRPDRRPPTRTRVERRVEGHQRPRTWVITRAADGAVTRTCTPVGSGCPTPPAGSTSSW